MSEVKEPEREGYVSVTISMLPSNVIYLDRLAAEKRLSRSEFVRQIFGLWLHDQALKFQPPLTGEVVDANGTTISFGLVTDDLKRRIESGELRIKTKVGE